MGQKSIVEYLNIGNKIKLMRKNKGLKQKDVAKQLGIAVTTYSNYENGNRTPDLNSLKNIANALDVEIDELLDIKPLPPKSVQLFSNDTREIVLNSKELEFKAFDEFLENIGYKTFIDATKLDNPKGADGNIWVICDLRNNEYYTASTEKLDDLIKQILSYTKFKVYEMLTSLEKIENKDEIEFYKKRFNL